MAGLRNVPGPYTVGQIRPFYVILRRVNRGKRGAVDYCIKPSFVHPVCERLFVDQIHVSRGWCINLAREGYRKCNHFLSNLTRPTE